MAEHPYMPLWTDAYLADTVHLSCLESGAYLHLLICAWRTPDCALPDDDKKLARMAKCTPREWNKVRAAVMAFWDLDNGKWTQKRLLKERNHVHANMQQRVHAGQASALKRWGKAVTDATSPLQRDRNGDHATHTHIDSDSSLRSESPRSLKSHRSPGVNGRYRFTEFWQCWDIPGTKREPRRAEAKYQSLIRNGEATHDELCEGVRRYMQECRQSGRDVRYIKHPTSWLNGGCWKDEERHDGPDRRPESVLDSAYRNVRGWYDENGSGD